MEKDGIFGLVLPFGDASPQIAPGVFIAPGAVVVGDVTLGEGVSVWYNSVIRGDEHPVIIGARTNIQDLCMCHQTGWVGPLTVGEDCVIGHRVVLHGCTVGNRCLIGMGSVILDRAEIGDECIVAAGAVVPEGMIVPPRTLVAGVPAKVRKQLDEAGVSNFATFASHYVGRAREHAEVNRTAVNREKR